MAGDAPISVLLRQKRAAGEARIPRPEAGGNRVVVIRQYGCLR
jgi:hypothetical protein